VSFKLRSLSIESIAFVGAERWLFVEGTMCLAFGVLSLAVPHS